MASAVRQITSVGGDIRKIARLLQKKAPPGHMLAYINQEEADLLKERGGSGQPHEDTGIPSFQISEEEFQSYKDAANYADRMSPEDLKMAEGGEAFASPYRAPIETPTFGVSSESNIPAGPDLVSQLSVPEQYAQYGAGREIADAYRTDLTLPEQYAQYGQGQQFGAAQAALQSLGQPTEVKPDLDLLGKLKNVTGFSEETLKKLGISGIQGLIGAYQANKAQEAGQAGKQELSALAAPYRQQAQEMIGKAQRGELTPVGRQQLQAVQAQAAQGAERRGGVGAQQSMAQVEAFRQQLLQGQYDYGLKLSGIADNIVTGAIKTGLQADQYVTNLTNSYFGNMARIMAGVPDKPTTGA